MKSTMILDLTDILIDWLFSEDDKLYAIHKQWERRAWNPRNPGPLRYYWDFSDTNTTPIHHLIGLRIASH